MEDHDSRHQMDSNAAYFHDYVEMNGAVDEPGYPLGHVHDHGGFMQNPSVWSQAADDESINQFSYLNDTYGSGPAADPGNQSNASSTSVTQSSGATKLSNASSKTSKSSAKQNKVGSSSSKTSKPRPAKTAEAPESSSKKKSKKGKAAMQVVEEPEQNEYLDEDDEDDPRRSKFLERNRIAASKCRQKKKEWVSDLEGTKTDLEALNSGLSKEYQGLVNEVSGLKNRLMEHANCNDPNIDMWIENEARKFVQNQRKKSQAGGVMGHMGGYGSQVSDDMISPQFSPSSTTQTFNFDHMPNDMFDQDGR